MRHARNSFSSPSYVIPSGVVEMIGLHNLDYHGKRTIATLTINIDGAAVPARPVRRAPRRALSWKQWRRSSTTSRFLAILR